MSAKNILDELKSLGDEQAKKTMLRHGAREPVFGVKVEHLQKIRKRIKMDYALALELFDTGNSDAMYLAGLIADDAKMTKKDLQKWVEAAYWPWLSEYTVPWVASSGPHGPELALKWMDSKKDNIASAGWSTYRSLVAIKDDAELDMDELKKLLQRVETTIHDQPNRTRYCMNGFVIAVGSHIKAMTDLALKTAARFGEVIVDMEGTACKMPSVAEAIAKVKARGAHGKKRKSAKC